jgi:hypothetical protein
MNISEEIKRMLSLLESELGNVKPLITEEGDGTDVETNNTPLGILKRAISTGCWADKKYTYSDGKPITKDPEGRISTVNENYLYALNKIDPNIKAGDPFVKLNANGIDVYMFGTPTTNPQYPGAYLAVARTASIPTFDKTKPNQNYLESHGWNCAAFSATQGASTQETRMNQDQVNLVRELTSELNKKNDGYSYYNTKSEVDGLNYQVIDLKTGSGLIPVNRLEPFKDSPANTFFIYRMTGKKTDKGDTVTSVEDALAFLGYTNVRPTDMTSMEAINGKMVGEFCKEFDCTRNLALKEYALNNPTLMVYPMNDEQKAEAAKPVLGPNGEVIRPGIKVFNSGDIEQGAKMSKRDARRGEREFGKTKADRQSCTTAISVLGTCAKFNTDKDCQNYITQQAAKGAITLPTDDSGKPISAYQPIVNAYKEILRNCVVLADQINIPNNMEATFLQLQRSSGIFGLNTPTSTTVNATTNVNTRDKSNLGTNESLNNSIKSVITEAINKNNNKNLDSIIKKNLRKYIG